MATGILAAILFVWFFARWCIPRRLNSTMVLVLIEAEGGRNASRSFCANHSAQCHGSRSRNVRVGICERRLLPAR